jgi:hypothetical protein
VILLWWAQLDLLRLIGGVNDRAGLESNGRHETREGRGRRL